MKLDEWFNRVVRGNLEDLEIIDTYEFRKKVKFVELHS